MTASRWRAMMIMLVALVASVAAPAASSASSTLPSGVVFESVAVPGTGLVALAAGDNGLLFSKDEQSIEASVDGLGSVRHVDALQDGTVLATVAGLDEVLRIDARDGAVVGRYRLPAGFCPGSVAATGGHAFIAGRCFDFSGGVLDLTTGAVSPVTGPSNTIAAGSIGQPGQVVTVQKGQTTANLSLIDISTGQARLLASRYFDATFWDVRISPDGRHVALADMFWRNARVLRTDDLTEPFRLPRLSLSPRAVAWLDNTRLAVGGLEDEAPAAVYDLDRPSDEPVLLHWPTPQDNYICVRCLAPSADGQRLVAATMAHFADGPAQLQSFGTRRASLTVSGPDSAPLTRPVLLRGQLRIDGDQLPPAGSTVQIYRQPEYASDEPVLLGHAQTDASGNVSFTDVPPQKSTYRYALRFGGGGATAGARADHVVQVTPAPATLTSSFSRTSTKGKRVSGTLTVHLTPLVEVRQVSIEARTATGTQYFDRQQLDSSGTLRLPMTVTPPAEVIVTFIGGSRQDNARTVTSIAR